MKRFFPWIVLVLVLISLAASCRMPKGAPGSFDFPKFGKIPVLEEGRLKPLDTVARNALVILRGRQTVRLEEGRTLPAIQWLADVAFNVPGADQYPTFAINNPEVLGLFGWQQGERKYFSYAELEPFFGKIDTEGQQAAGIDSAQRSPYQTAIYNLRNGLIVYQRLKHSLWPEGTQEFASEVKAYEKLLPIGREAMKKGGQEPASGDLALFKKFTEGYQMLAEASSIQPVPPVDAAARRNGDWVSLGTSLSQALKNGTVHPLVKAYAEMGEAYRAGKADLFNKEVDAIAASMAVQEPVAAGRASFEFLFNHIAPFYQSMQLYVLVFLLVCGSWLGWSNSLGRSAVYVTLVALALHTFGLAARMYLQGRPPVTNLYSSAVFIGWGTVIIGLFLERIFRDGIGLACASVIGFITLIIAHHLAGSGDTLEMLRAVLDTNIWLATHVVSITIGYSAMFLAGMLAMFYVLRGVLTRSLTRDAAQSLARMTYGVLCFATLFSFVGTVLGGIWADQSWGRFWGWDPKENGALLIVLWCAIILHARWGGYIRQRGLMVLAIFGNVITSFSWFGVNMLGVGLHSYGFMDKAFPWLMVFVASQLGLIALAAVPPARWRSPLGN
ncbi:MAG: cytochrome c biogenesis protein CcsA [Verrucomicrobia bacterium]|nr:cytochrome c biogenesis protein CcsA [Verrucomicrobiota bacterium]